MAPATPKIVVMIHPILSSPGFKARAMSPTTNPMMIVQRMCMGEPPGRSVALRTRTLNRVTENPRPPFVTRYDARDASFHFDHVVPRALGSGLRDAWWRSRKLERRMATGDDTTFPGPDGLRR